MAKGDTRAASRIVDQLLDVADKLEALAEHALAGELRLKASLIREEVSRAVD